MSAADINYVCLADADISTIAVKALKQLIATAGLTLDGCIEKPELLQRAREAQAVLAAKSSAPPQAAHTGTTAVHAQPLRSVVDMLFPSTAAPAPDPGHSSTSPPLRVRPPGRRSASVRMSCHCSHLRQSRCRRRSHHRGHYRSYPRLRHHLPRRSPRDPTAAPQPQLPPARQLQMLPLRRQGRRTMSFLKTCARLRRVGRLLRWPRGYASRSCREAASQVLLPLTCGSRGASARC